MESTPETETKSNIPLTRENSEDNPEQSESLSKSWVLVEPKSNDPDVNLKSCNEFYLNCSQEPVQELNVQDLNLHHPESDSDTDGISVISESEPPTESTDEESHSSEHDNVVVLNAQEHIVTSTTNVNSHSCSQLTYYVMTLSILVLLVPFHWYLSPVGKFDETKSPDIPMGKHKRDESSFYESRNKVPDLAEKMTTDPVLYCTHVYEDSDYMYRENDIKQCIKRIEKTKKQLKDKYNQQYKKVLHSKENDDRVNDINEMYSSDEYSDIKNNENEQYVKKTKYRDHEETKFGTYKANKRNMEYLQNELDSEEKSREDNKNKVYLEREEKLKAKEAYLKQKEQFLEKIENELKRRVVKNTFNNKDEPELNLDMFMEEFGETNDVEESPKYVDTSENVPPKVVSEYKGKNIKFEQNKNYDNKKSRKHEHNKYDKEHFDNDENISKKYKQKNAKHMRENDYNVRHTTSDDKCRSNKETCQHKTKHYGTKNQKNAKSGKWYTDMLEWRSRMRESGEKNEWLFNRARLRNSMRKKNLFHSSYQ